MSEEGVLILRNRDVSRAIPPRAIRCRAEPIQPVTAQSMQDSDSDVDAQSSSPPRLAPVADFDVNLVLDLDQLVMDVETGQFSAVRENSVNTSTAYQSPTWLSMFVQYTLEQQALARSAVDMTSTLSTGILPSRISHEAVPRSAQEIICSRYRKEQDILRGLRSGTVPYGTAYTLYTRYRVLSRVAAGIGLDINKPTQTATIDGVLIAYSDLFAWAGLQARTFANVKGIIVASEHLREALAAQTSWTNEQRALLQNLTVLATDPHLQAGRLVCLNWRISDLSRHVQRTVASRPHSTRARTSAAGY